MTNPHNTIIDKDNSVYVSEEAGGVTLSVGLESGPIAVHFDSYLSMSEFISKVVLFTADKVVGR